MTHYFGYICLSVFLGAAATAAPLHDAAKAGDTDQVAQLLAEGADINEADAFGTALHWAALNDQIEVIDLLVQNGADLEVPTETLGTPLHAAAARGRADAAARLIAHGADIEARKSDDFTPLLVATGGNRPEVARLLIDAGADVNAVVMSKTPLALGEITALHVAVRTERDNIADMLRASGAGPRPVASAADALAGADPARGKTATSWCIACHHVDPEAEHTEREARIAGGPPLIGVYGRPVGSFEGYEYSAVLRAYGGTWEEDLLYAFITSPMLTIPGTKMSWHDGWSTQEAADIVAYLKSLAE